VRVHQHIRNGECKHGCNERKSRAVMKGPCSYLTCTYTGSVHITVMSAMKHSVEKGDRMYINTYWRWSFRCGERNITCSDDRIGEIRQRVHTGKRTYGCDERNKTCVDEICLNLHKNIHT